MVVTVEGAAVKLAGWELRAALTFTEGGVLVRTVPGNEVPEVYRNASDFCEHCHTSRRRNDVFVLAHEDGRFIQVGRNCLRDFLGHDDAESIAAYAAVIMEIAGVLGADHDNDGFFGDPAQRVSIRKFLAWTIRVINEDGWVSMSNPEGKQPTKLGVWSELCSKDRKQVPLTENEIAQADEAIEYTVKTLSAKANLSDYEHNLLVAAKSEVVGDRIDGILASLIPWWKRSVGRELEGKRLAATSAHQGTVSKRQVFTLDVNSVASYQGDWGPTYFHRMTDGNGNAFLWKGSNELETGKRYTVKATVKEHGTDKHTGAAVTIVTRLVALTEKEG